MDPGETDAGVTVLIEKAADVISARSEARAVAVRFGFGLADQARLTAALSELARNVVTYAGSGTCTISGGSEAGTTRIQAVVEDHGPGIRDIDAALEEGFSTGGGLGAGLAAAKRLAREFEIESEPGHTRVTIALTR